MKIVWITVAGVLLWQSAQALPVKSPITVTERAVPRSTPVLTTETVTPTVSATKSTVVPLLSAILTRPEGVVASDLIRRASYAPAVIVRKPTVTGPTRQTYSPTTGSPVRVASVPDNTATAGLLGMGLLATALAKRRHFAKP